MVQHESVPQVTQAAALGDICICEGSNFFSEKNKLPAPLFVHDFNLLECAGWKVPYSV